MIGRSPEIYGKKLEPREMILIIIALLLAAITQLSLSALALTNHTGVTSLGNPGSHGISEVLYAYASGLGNNGSAFGGLNSNNPFYNITVGLAMLVGRIVILFTSLAIAGSLVEKKLIPVTSRFPTANFIFVLVLTGMVILLGTLTFFPVWVIGPILEHTQIYH